MRLSIIFTNGISTEKMKKKKVQSQQQIRLLIFGMLLERIRKTKKMVAEYKQLRRKKLGVSEKIKRKYLFEINTEFAISKDISKRNTRRFAEIPLEVLAENTIDRAHFQIAGPSTLDVPVVTAELEEHFTSNTQIQHIQNTDQDIPNDTRYPQRHRTARGGATPTPCVNQENSTKYAPDKDLCMAYERAGISNRFATLLYFLHAKNFGIDFSSVICSKSTICRYRQMHQKNEADRMFDEFDRGSRYTLHWDGKTFNNRGKKDKRIGVVVTNRGICKTLDVAQMNSTTAEANADMIWSMVEKWNIQNSIDSICYDTENTNSGHLSGVCKRLKDRFGRDILELACRRHIHEIILKAASQTTIERLTVSTSPTIPMFEKFHRTFNSPGFDRNTYAGLEDDHFFLVLLPDDEKKDLLNFCEQQLRCAKHCRNDYNELLKLIVILICPEKRNLYTIHAPGSCSRARYMCHMLYAIKMFLYRDQIELLRGKLDAIRRFILFVLKVYVKSWFTACLPIVAPRNDLALLKRINSINEIIPSTAQITMKKLKSHLWYLSEVLVALAFFDPHVPLPTKREMVANLTRELPNQPNKYRFTLSPQTDIEELQLEHFVSKRTLKFFEITGIQNDFLGLDASEWHENVHYINGQRIASDLSVVNDAAERSIKLYQHCESHSANNCRKTQIMQIVEEHRQHFPATKKQFLISKLSE